MIRELPWTYLGLTCLTFFVLPPVLFDFAAWKEPRMWLLAAVSALSSLAVFLDSLKGRTS
jgi:hypothetical protein